jgi:hypothetical protein
MCRKHVASSAARRVHREPDEDLGTTRPFRRTFDDVELGAGKPYESFVFALEEATRPSTKAGKS